MSEPPLRRRRRLRSPPSLLSTNSPPSGRLKRSRYAHLVVLEISFSASSNSARAVCAPALRSSADATAVESSSRSSNLSQARSTERAVVDDTSSPKSSSRSAVCSKARLYCSRSSALAPVFTDSATAVASARALVSAEQ